MLEKSGFPQSINIWNKCNNYRCKNKWLMSCVQRDLNVQFYWNKVYLQIALWCQKLCFETNSREYCIWTFPHLTHSLYDFRLCNHFPQHHLPVLDNPFGEEIFPKSSQNPSPGTTGCHFLFLITCYLEEANTVLLLVFLIILQHFQCPIIYWLITPPNPY